MNLNTELVELPSGKTLRLREWTGVDHDDFFRRADGVAMDGHLFAVAIASCAVDDDGKRLFDVDEDADTIHRTWPFKDLSTAWDVIKVQNLLTKESIAAVEKN